MRGLLVILLSFMMPFLSMADSGIVTSVIDGNTLTVKINQEEIKITLSGIDCPELNQSFGEEAKKLLQKLLLGKEVRVEVLGKDRKGNRLAEVFVMKNGVDPRVDLLKQGLAWVSEKNPKSEFSELEARAKEKSKGLWCIQNPTPPWIFRQQQSMTEPKSS